MPMLAPMCTWMSPTSNERSSAARSRRPARGGLVAGREHDRELVAAEPGEVAGAQDVLEPGPDLAQDLVAGVMAERVVEP